jgi:hypothetical protein
MGPYISTSKWEMTTAASVYYAICYASLLQHQNISRNINNNNIEHPTGLIDDGDADAVVLFRVFFFMCKKTDFSIRGVADYDPTMVMLVMTILIHFWMIYCATEPPTRTRRSNLRYTAVQPSYLAHARPFRC